MLPTISTLMAAALAWAGAPAEASGADAACRALDEAARGGARATVAAAQLARAAPDLEPRAWVSLAGLDELRWEAEAGTVARVPFREPHAAVLREVVRTTHADRTALLADALALQDDHGFRACALAIGRLAGAQDGDWVSAASWRAGPTALDRDAFAEGVHLWAGRTAPTADRVRRVLADTSPAMRAALALGVAGGPRAGEASLGAARTRLSLALMGDDPSLDRYVASLVAGRARATGDDVDGAQLLRLLGSSDAGARVHAASALGALESMAAVRALVERLADDDPRVRRAAHRALRRTTRQSLDASPEAWRAWHADSRRWLAETLPVLRSDLASGVSGHVVRALMEIGHHREHGRTTAPLVIAASRDPEPAVAAMAATILGRLGTRDALARLTEMLRATAPEVSAAARAALSRAVGRDLGAAPEPWLEALEVPR